MKTIPILISKSIVAISAATLLAASAAAQQAYTTRQVNLRAGPDRGYPQVAVVYARQAVYVNGCITDYRWCDVTAGPNRGWAYAAFLEYPYQDNRLPIYGNGPVLALPIVSFILGNYWGDHYRNRPWYGQQNNWNNWRPGNRPPPNWQRPQPGYRTDRPNRPDRPDWPRQPEQMQPQRPPVFERPNGGRPQVQQPQQPRQPQQTQQPQGQPPRGQPPQGFPQQQGPGPSRPTGSMNL
jgi:uncharacterized protein YraI